MIDCKTNLEMVDDYLGGHLDDTSRQEVDRHLRHCAACQARFDESRDFRLRLQSQMVAKPVAGFADRLLDRTVKHHENKARHQKSFFNGAIAASVVIAATAAVLNYMLPSAGPAVAQQTIALHQVKNIALALDSREELKGATITLRLPDSMEIKGFPGQHMISWKTDINRGTNLLSLPIVAVAEKDGFLVARLQHGNKSKEYKVELSVRKPDVTGGASREEVVVISRANAGTEVEVRLDGMVGGHV